MCGIFAIISREQGRDVNCAKNSCKSVREMAYENSGRQRHRGPDHTGVVDWLEDEGVLMVHERLAILGVRHGHQPFVSKDGNLLLIANGEIYNYREIADMISRRRGNVYVPRSDSEVIMDLYEEFGLDLMAHLTGMFAFVLYDRQRKRFVSARDPIGIIPLYQGRDYKGNLFFTSEMKCLVGLCKDVAVMKPGVAIHGTPGQVEERRFFTPSWFTEIPTQKYHKEVLRQSLENAVRSHLQCDVPFGALLSGGLDSSLVASIATKLKRETDPNFRLKTFSVGLKDAPDLLYARNVAQFIGSDHEEVLFTVEESLDCIRSIIYHTESYDVSVIRCSTPMFILTRYVKSCGLKMVLSGEGADEVFGGYLYFHEAPNNTEFHHETVSLLRRLQFSECLRANKSTMAWGLELRVPFLDTDFLNTAMQIRPSDRMPQKNDTHHRGLEKFILRDAFSDGYLPEEVLWRQKEQFSDGVGYAFIDELKRYIDSQISNEEMTTAETDFPFNTPSTKEEYFYRKIFHEFFPDHCFSETVIKWNPRADWGCSLDPSGRAQHAHNSSIV